MKMQWREIANKTVFFVMLIVANFHFLHKMKYLQELLFYNK